MSRIDTLLFSSVVIVLASLSSLPGILLSVLFLGGGFISAFDEYGKQKPLLTRLGYIVQGFLQSLINALQVGFSLYAAREFQ